MQETIADGDKDADTRPVGDVCAGCDELSARVERLERLLAGQMETSIESHFGTVACYLVCLGLNALVLVVTATSPMLYAIGLPFAAGAITSMLVCQVFVLRSVSLRLCRSILSLSVGVIAFATPIFLMHGVSVNEFTPYVFLMLAAVSTAGWTATKTVAYIGGWRIQVPGGSRTKVKLQVRDLLFITFVAALWMTAFRFCWPSLSELTEVSEILFYLSIIALTTFCSAGLSISISRILLSRSRLRYGLLCGVVAIAIFLVGGILSYTFLYIDGSGLSLEVALYIAPAGMFLAISPLGTFSLMRLAGYRVVSRAMMQEPEESVV